MEQKQTQEEGQIPKASFEDLCPDFDCKIKEIGYEDARAEKFVGKNGAERSLNNSKCCIVGEAFDIRG